MTLPTSSIEVEKRGLGGTTVSNESVHAVIGCASDGPLMVARSVQRKTLNSTFVSGPAVSATQIATDGIDAEVIFVRVPATARAASKTLDLDAFTGDSTVTVTGTSTIAGDIRINFTTGAVVGVAGGVYRVSVDGGTTYGSGVALGTNTAISLYGVTFTFQSGQTVSGTIGCLLIPASQSIYNIDLTGVTGTSVVSISGTPNDAHDGVIDIIAGGNPGFDGIKLAVSLDGGRRFAPTKRLGTSLSFAIDDRENVPSGITLAFNPVVDDDVVAFVAMLRTKFLAHENGTTFHTAADPATYTITTPVDIPSAIDAMGEMLTAGAAHAGVVGTTHGAADTTAINAINAIAVPLDAIELLEAAIAFRAAFFGDGTTTNSGHTLRTAGTVHNSTDGTNLVTLSNPEFATLETGDKIIFKTTAPEPQASDIVAAMQVLKESIYVADFDFVHIVAEVDQTFAGTVSDKLDALELASTYTLGIMSARDRACGMTYDEVTGASYPGETLGDWAFRLDQAFDVFSGERVAIGAGMYRATNPITLWTKRVPVVWRAVNRLLTRPVQEELGRKQSGQIAAKTAITNAANDFVEYNARNDQTLVDRFVVIRDFDDADGLFFAKGSTMAPSGSDFSLIAYIRVMNFATRLFKQVGQEQLGNGLALETTGPRAGKAREVELRRLDREIKTAIESQVSPTKGTASGLTVHASRDDNLLPVVGGPPPTLTAVVVIVPIGYVGGFRGNIRLAAKLPTV